MLKLLIPAFVLATGFAAPLPAAPAAPTARVAFGDLNLTSREGVRTLDARISNAIRKVCLADPTERDLATIAFVRSCTSAATAAVAEQRRAAVAQAAQTPSVRLSAS